MAYKIGDKVRFKFDSTVGEILEVRAATCSSSTEYLIKWNVSHSVPEWRKHGEDLLLIDSEADARIGTAIQAKLDEATSALEKAYEAFCDAKELAYQGGTMFYLMDKDLVSLDKFAAVAGNFGWSSSSLYC